MNSRKLATITLLVVIMFTVAIPTLAAKPQPPIMWPIEPSSNPWQNVPEWHNTRLITAYCDMPQNDYNSDGRVNAKDAWVQVENPYNVSIEIMVIQVLDVNPCICEYPKTSLLIMQQGMARITGKLLSAKYNQGYHEGYKILGFVIVARIPEGYPYAGDTLDCYSPTWPDSEWNIAYFSILPTCYR